MIQEDISEIEMDTSKDCHGIHDGIHGLKRKHGWTPWLFMGIEISMFHGYPPWIEHLEFSKTVIVQVKMPSPLKWSFETRRPSGVFSVEVSQVRGGPQVTLVVSRLKWSSMGDDWMIWGAPTESGIPDPSFWVRAKYLQESVASFPAQNQLPGLSFLPKTGPIGGMQIPLGAALVLQWQHHQLLCGVPQGAMHVNFNMFLITYCWYKHLFSDFSGEHSKITCIWNVRLDPMMFWDVL